MLKIVGNEVTVSQGDSGYCLPVKLPTATQNEHGVTAIAALKKDLQHQTPLWQIENTLGDDNTVSFLLQNEHTDFCPGQYLWDVRIRYSNGYEKHIIPPSKFTIMAVVGRVSH